jgi:hypothetical protein
MYNQYSIERIDNQIKELENIKKTYQAMPQPNPITNFINTNQPQNTIMFEWRILNDNEEVDNLYVKNKTLFVGDDIMILKDVDGKLEKWNIKKTYPVDKKDIKINELEEEISKLKEILNNGHKKSNASTKASNKQTTDATITDVEQSEE